MKVIELALDQLGARAGHALLLDIVR